MNTSAHQLRNPVEVLIVVSEAGEEGLDLVRRPARVVRVRVRCVARHEAQRGGAHVAAALAQRLQRRLAAVPAHRHRRAHRQLHEHTHCGRHTRVNITLNDVHEGFPH